MKSKVFLICFFVMTIGFMPQIMAEASVQSPIGNTIVNNDDVRIRKIGHSLIFEYKNARVAEMELTRRGELFIDGEEIDLNRSEKELAIELYDEIMDLRREVCAIGLDATVFGAEVAAYALSSVARSLGAALLNTENEDRLVQKMEKTEKRIDRKAQAFEKKVEKVIRKKLTRCEKLHNELARSLKVLPKISLNDKN